MSEHWPESGSEEPNAETEVTASSSADEASHDVDAIATSAEATATDEGVAAEEEDERTVFLVELVRAIQTTASLERMRTVEETERRREAHIDRIRSRQASEADRMRELADEDMSAIDAWADDETKRIQLERERRATELNQDLETSLEEHRTRIDREIELVESAIATYRADIDAFFESLDRETDLIRLAQQAPRRPIFPTLDALAEDAAVPAADTADVADVAETPDMADVAATAEDEPSSVEALPAEADDGATGEAEPEPAVVGVMDPGAAAEPVESWAAAPETDPEPETGPEPETSPEPVSAAASDDADQEVEAGEPPEPVTAATALGHGGLLLAAVPAKRPMSWLRRDANSGDRSNGDG